MSQYEEGSYPRGLWNFQPEPQEVVITVRLPAELSRETVLDCRDELVSAIEAAGLGLALVPDDSFDGTRATFDGSALAETVSGGFL